MNVVGELVIARDRIQKAAERIADPEMLDAVASERKAGSRLSCQIAVSDALDGLVVYLPEAQY